MKPYLKDISSWTIKEINEYLLGENNLPPDFIRMLKNDPRKGVREIMRRWLMQKNRLSKQWEHLHNMRIEEKLLLERGFNLIAGIDEAGRGPLAGPVVAAAVILGQGRDHLWQEIDDSKKLNPVKREKLYEIIMKNACAVGIGIVDSETIDRINIHNATLRAMKLAACQLRVKPDFILSDGFSVPEIGIPQKAIKGGDSLCLSIAAASIIAKVTRDRIMDEYDNLYKGYGFSKNKGYPTPEHKNALKVLGLSPIHRRTFNFT